MEMSFMKAMKAKTREPRGGNVPHEGDEGQNEGAPGWKCPSLKAMKAKTKGPRDGNVLHEGDEGQNEGAPG